MEENGFIHRAFQRGIISFDQLKECLKIQEALVESGSSVPIWEVLVLKGHLSEDQVASIQKGREGPKTYPFGPFTITKKLGEGGMGVVYLAQRQSDRAVVALKLLPQRFSEDSNAVKRFEREAKIAIALDHPNLIKGYEYGQVNDRWYFAMEYVNGKVVGRLIAEHIALEERFTIQVATQIAQALQATHEAGIVHRDIKPDNIIIGYTGVAKLMDLGLAKAIDGATAVTQNGFAVGTPHYMAPEQILGSKEIDVRSDIYSLGATLYHMLTGIQPFKGTNMMEIMNRQLSNELESPAALRPGLSRGTCHIIEKMMAGCAADRYPAPSELLSDLMLVLEGKEPRTRLIDVGKSLVRRMVG